MNLYNRKGKFSLLFATALYAATMFSAANAVASVSFEAPLDTPTIKINKYANDIVVAGTGLIEGPSTINANVPGFPKQVLIYWEGEVDLNKNDHLELTGDDTIEINGHSIKGELISGPTNVVQKRYTSTYRADVTGKRLVRWGNNSLRVSGLDGFTSPNGAGIAVLHKNFKRGKGQVITREGGDLALSFDEPFTHEQTFAVKPSSNDRMATISLFVSGVDDELGGTPITRTSAIDVTIGDQTTTYDNVLFSSSGAQWDTLTIEIVIPAGEDTVAVQLAAVNNLNLAPNSKFQPASFVWNFASLSVEKDFGVYKYAHLKKKGKLKYLKYSWSRKIRNHFSKWRHHW